jgi:hypothetical protein
VSTAKLNRYIPENDNVAEKTSDLTYGKTTTEPENLVDYAFKYTAEANRVI